MIIWDKNRSPEEEAEALAQAMDTIVEDPEMEALVEEIEQDLESLEAIREEIHASGAFLSKGFGLGK